MTRENADRVAAATTWLLAFGLVAYLGLSGGGYDTIVHGEVGIVVWWVVALGALAGLLPRTRIGAAAGGALVLLALLAVWTSVGAGDSESAERTAADLARLSAYLGILALAICIQGRESLRWTVYGVAAGIVLVAVFAAGSRLLPAVFPDGATDDFLPGASKRLSYPLNYWNAVACLMAIGVPLLLGVAASARTRAAGAAAAAAVPLVVLTAMMTLSRGGALSVLLGTLVYLALAPNPARQLATTAAAAVGSAVLIGAVLQKDRLRDGLETAAARSDGRQVLLLAVVVCGLVAAAQVYIARRADRSAERESRLSPGASAMAFAAAGVLAVAIAAVLIGPGDAWKDFKEPSLPADREFEVGRLGEASGSGRYQYWKAALEAVADDPVNGTGAGTYGLWWSREGDFWYGLRDAHSLYLEKFAEQGLLGFALIVSLIGLVLCAALMRTLRAPPGARAPAAAATAGFAAFAFMAAIDWVWEMGVIAAAALLLAGALLVTPDERADDESRADERRRRGPAGWALTAALVLAAVAGVLAILPAVAGTAALRDSREAAADGDLQGALDHVADAERAQPDAAAPRLQRALLLERGGDLDAAIAAARSAADAEPTNYRIWVVIARIEAQRREADAATRAFRRARSLNPHAPFLGGS